MSSAIERMSVPRRDVPAGKPLNELLRENQTQRQTAAPQARDSLQTAKPLNQLLRENVEQRRGEVKQAKASLQDAKDFRMERTLSGALGLNKAKQEDEKGRSSGGDGKGELSRPTHASFYQPVPVGGMAPPKPDERSAAIQDAERVRQRGRSRRI